jgi:hypothetical protein
VGTSNVPVKPGCISSWVRPGELALAACSATNAKVLARRLATCSTGRGTTVQLADLQEARGAQLLQNGGGV